MRYKREKYDKKVEEQSDIARKLFSIQNTIALLEGGGQTANALKTLYEEIALKQYGEYRKLLDEWEAKKQNYPISR